MNVIENNKLIAEFMNYPDLGTEGDFSYLKYNTSRDSLMPVVDRIEGIIDEHGCAKYNVRVEQSWVDIIDNHTSDEIVKVDGDNRREATYKAVVEFIKQYNK